MTDDIVKLLKSLADPTRLEIIQCLALRKEGACSDVSKHFELSQPTLSHHFKILVEAEAIIPNKVGTSMHYSLNKPLLRSIGLDINKLAGAMIKI